MKKFMCLFIASLALLTKVQADTCSVQEEPCCFEKSIYAKIFYGTDFTKRNLESRDGSKNLGYALSGAIGYTFYPTLSVEAEYSYRQNYHSNRYRYYVVDRRLSSYMVNVIKDLRLCKVNGVAINTFIGFGAGCDYQIFEGAHFSWQYLT